MSDPYQVVSPVEASVRTEDITKRFGDLIGPNGAGKTTLVRMLTTVIQPTEETAFVAGSNICENADGVRRNLAQGAAKL